MKYQLGLPGTGTEAKRKESFRQAFIDALRKYGSPQDYSKEAEITANKEIIAGAISDYPSWDKVFEIIRLAPDNESCRKAVFLLFQGPEFPSLETIVRSLREAKVILKGKGELLPGWKSRGDGNLEDLAEGFLGNKRAADRELQSQLYRALQEAYPDQGWKWELKLTMVDTPLRGKNREIDIACPSLRLAIEVDGYEYHKDEESFRRDRQKARAMKSAGWTMLQFSGGELSITNGIDNAVAEIRRHIDRLRPSKKGF